MRSSSPSRRQAAAAMAQRPEADRLLLSRAKSAMAKKRFSQNFLISASTLDGIVRVLDLQPDETILEIGPGLGFLTERLMGTGKPVIAVELERDMVAQLGVTFDGQTGLTVIAKDFLAYALADIPGEGPVKVVGNIPYNITSQVLLKMTGALLDEPEKERLARQRIRQVTLMVQREVAHRLPAKPCTKAYSPLSIAVQLYYEPWIEFIVPPAAFHPQPGVHSAVVTLVPRPQPLVNLTDPVLFNRMVRGVFQQRRKTLRNTLPTVANLSTEATEDLLHRVGVDPQSRPEALDVATLGAIANALATQRAS